MGEQSYAVAGRTKYVLVAVLVILAFFAAYGFAASRMASPPASAASYQNAATSACTGAGTGTGDGTGAACGMTGTDQAAAASGCDSCGTGTPADAPEGTAVVEGDVQRLAVDVSKGYFDPTVIRVKAGVPTELEFGQGSGCLAEVMFPQFGIREDLTSGGALVSLPALDAGEYEFSCGMEMVFGTLVVE